MHVIARPSIIPKPCEVEELKTIPRFLAWGMLTNEIQQVEKKLGIWMSREGIVSSGFFDFEVPMEWETKHTWWARRHADTELKRQAIPSDTNDFTQEHKRDCSGRKNEEGEDKITTRMLVKRERGLRMEQKLCGREAGRREEDSSDPERSNRV